MGKDEKVGAKKMVLWQSRMVSTGCNMLIFGYMAIYCTDTLKMPAALVGTLMMLSKIVDAFGAAIAGVVVDRTKTKIGRGRPYELCILGLWLCTWLMFSCPSNVSLVTKSIWVFLMYILATGVFTSFLNACNTVYMVRAFSKQEHYVAINSYGNLIVMLFVVAFNVSFPIFMKSLATSAYGWSILTAAYAIPLTILGVLRFLTIKETNNVDVASSDKISIRDIMTVLKTNPYIYIVGIMMLVYNFVLNMGVNTYYFTYIVKDVGLLGILSLTQIIVLPIVILFPPLIKKISLKKLMVAGLLISSLGYFINFIAYGNFILLIIANIFVGAGNVPASMLVPLMIIDCAEYNEWKKGPRLEGTMSCVTGFATTFGAAFGSGCLGVLLSVSGYTGSLGTTSSSSLLMIRLLYSLIPMILYIVVILIFNFYKLDKLMPKIREENEEARQIAIQNKLLM
jgi:Na+/melibiose symporter and related transporters